MKKALAAEFIGTFWLVLGDCGSAVLANPASTGSRRSRVAGRTSDRGCFGARLGARRSPVVHWEHRLRSMRNLHETGCCRSSTFVSAVILAP